MAPGTTTRPRLSFGSLGGKRQKREGPQPIATAGGKSKPNKLLLSVLGLVALVAVGRLAMPGMFGGGSHGVATFTVPLTDRHFALHAPPTTAPGGTTAATVARPTRDPFAPAPGYGS
jgi:hypothetical protein